MAARLSSDESDEFSTISEINVTPFVDVVLVLLVIFMVTAPMLVKEIMEIRLPRTDTGDGQVVQTLGIAINREGNVLLEGVLVDFAGLEQAAREALSGNPQAQAILAADQGVVYGKVVEVIDLLKRAGLERFAVQIERRAQDAPAELPSSTSQESP